MSNDVDPEVRIINHRPWLPLGKAIAIGVPIVIGAWILRGAVNDLNQTITELRNDRWTATDMTRYNLLLERANRGLPLSVPDVDDVQTITRRLNKHP